MSHGTMPGSRCRMLGCDFESTYSDPRLRRRSVNEHLATAHGIGRIAAEEEHLGCFYKGCGFKTSGSARFVQDALREHLVTKHQVDPKSPRIPREARRGER